MSRRETRCLEWFRRGVGQAGSKRQWKRFRQKVLAALDEAQWIIYVATPLHRSRDGDIVPPEQNRSITWVMLTMAVIIPILIWFPLASGYFREDPAGGHVPTIKPFLTRRTGRPAAIVRNDPLRGRIETDPSFNALVQLPNLPWVLGYGIRHQRALIALFILTEVGLVIAWLVLKRVERALAAEDRARPL